MNNISPALRSLFEGLFEKDPVKRLGNGTTGRSGGEEIKCHPWFEKVDWNALMEKKIKPPFIPKIKNELDVTHFDEEFTKI